MKRISRISIVLFLAAAFLVGSTVTPQLATHAHAVSRRIIWYVWYGYPPYSPPQVHYQPSWILDSRNNWRVGAIDGHQIPPENVVMTFQGDRNLVIYGNNPVTGLRHALWASGTQNINPNPASLRFQKDGNVVIYDAALRPRWATATKRGPNRSYRIALYNDGCLAIHQLLKGANDAYPIWVNGC